MFSQAKRKTVNNKTEKLLYINFHSCVAGMRKLWAERIVFWWAINFLCLHLRWLSTAMPCGEIVYATSIALFLIQYSTFPSGALAGVTMWLLVWTKVMAGAKGKEFTSRIVLCVSAYANHCEFKENGLLGLRNCIFFLYCVRYIVVNIFTMFMVSLPILLNHEQLCFSVLVIGIASIGQMLAGVFLGLILHMYQVSGCRQCFENQLARSIREQTCSRLVFWSILSLRFLWSS